MKLAKSFQELEQIMKALDSDFMVNVAVSTDKQDSHDILVSKSSLSLAFLPMRSVVCPVVFPFSCYIDPNSKWIHNCVGHRVRGQMAALFSIDT